ncbi:unnamed protein product, partial [Heterosigma akashiwo]
MVFNTEIKFRDQDFIDIILDHLHQNGYLKALKSLEEESGRVLHHYGKDVMFFRGLVLDGQWEDVEQFIQPLEGLSNRYNEGLFHLRKQRFLEMLENSDSDSDLTEVTDLLKSIEPLCNQATFHSLCYCLTLPSVRDHPDYGEWSEFGGRIKCFNSVVGFLDSIFPDQTMPKSRVPAHQLTALCEQAIMNQ